MCARRISAAQILAALALTGLRPAVFPITRIEGEPPEEACLICLADGLQDAADVLEGAIEREAVVIMRGSPAPDR